MKKKIIALRIAATVLLVGVVATITSSPSGTNWGVGIMSGAVQLSISTDADEIYLSSAFFGFILSLVATCMSIRMVGSISRFQWPLIWAVMGILSFVNEASRLMHGHIQVLLWFPLFQVIADWLSVRFLKRIETDQSSQAAGAQDGKSAVATSPPVT